MIEIKSGALPYSDDSGYEVEIAIKPPTEYFNYTRIELNPDSEFCSFDVERWPEVRSAIDKAVRAYEALTAENTPPRDGEL